MKVRIIAITTPEIPECEDTKDIIAYAARVSNPSNQNNKLTSSKLLKYCATHGHWSIFEMCNLVLEIETTRDIAHQIIRHRSFSYQEFSQRYAMSFGFELSEVRIQDKKNRQNSIETTDEELSRWWEWEQQQVVNLTNDIYLKAIEKGIAKEVARKVLPEGLTLTKIYMNGTIRSWIHYCQTRTHESAQKEHRIVAEECKKLLISKIPDISSLFENEDPNHR